MLFKSLALGAGFVIILSQPTKFGKLRWLGHLLRVTNMRLSYLIPLSVPSMEWKKLRGGY